MTWVVYVLLALNLVMLTWNLHTRTATGAIPTPQSREQVSDTVNQLPLLAELGKDALRLRATAIAASPSSTSGANQAAATATDAARESRTVSAIDSATSAASASGSGDEDTAATSVATGGTRADSMEKDATLSKTLSRACLTLGPLSANAPVEEMRTWLEQAGATVDVRTGERREVALYWVFFPPRETRAQAIAEVKRLVAEGVNDVVAVPKGDMANAISLGVFSRTASRDRRVKEMNQRGYQPSVAPRYRVKLATWVDLNAPAGALSDQEIQQRWPALEISRKPCGGAPVAKAEIAVGPEASYNVGRSEPRRDHF